MVPGLTINISDPGLRPGLVDNHHSLPDRAKIDQHPQGTADNGADDHPGRLPGDDLPDYRPAGATQQQTVNGVILPGSSRGDIGQQQDQADYDNS
jgi:hypothetical protein